MSVFLDTGVILAARNADDNLHERGFELFRRSLEDEFGRIYTSDYVLDETMTVLLSRTRNRELARNAVEAILKSELIETLWTDKKVFMVAIDKFGKHKKTNLSFTDCTILSHMEARKIDNLASFDSGFSGLVEVIR